jgi:hypothetical protein
MKKPALRLLMLSILTTSLVAVPAVTQVSAATSNTHVKKKKVVHQSPKTANPSAKSYSNNPYEEDEDRKRAAGGGGGY